MEIGDRYNIDYGPNKAANKLIEIRGFVDDDVIVFKWYKSSSKKWSYDIEYRSYFAMLKSGGYLIKK